MTRAFICVIGIIIALTAAGVIAGFVLEIAWLTDWRGVVPMAIPTALCFLLTGSGFVALGSEHDLWTRPPTAPVDHA